jgi:hypothetical protein
MTPTACRLSASAPARPTVSRRLLLSATASAAAPAAAVARAQAPAAAPAKEAVRREA